MPKDLFYESFFIIQYIQRNKIKAIILADIYANRYDFMDEKFAETVCQVLKIKLQHFIKPK